jgi:hypothetical protein
MGRTTRKKSVGTTRLLKKLYNEHDSITDEQAVAICERIQKEQGEDVSIKHVMTHFKDKKYRECRKDNAKNACRHKTDTDIVKLQHLWNVNGGKMMGRTNVHIVHVMQQTNMTYSEIGQWFGQRRYKQKLSDSQAKVTCRDHSILKSYLRASEFW